MGITLKRDRKAKDCWLITTTDSEGFHRQLPITFDDMRELVRLWIDEVIGTTYIQTPTCQMKRTWFP